MKLPDIEYDRSMVQESSGAIGRVDQARRQALDVLSSGFQAFGQELIKTQTEKAAADVEAGLAADEADLASKRYLPIAAVKDELGDGFTTLPPEVQAHKQLVDDGQGGQVEVVPTYLVAGALFDKRAKERIQQASEGISAQGWQASFQTAALNDLTQRKRKLAMAQAGAALDDFRQQTLATVDQYVRGRAWDSALGTIDRSQALSEGEKATQRENVLAAKQRDETMTAKVQAAAQIEATSSGILQSARIPGYGWVDPAKAQEAIDAIPADDPNKDGVRKLVEHQVMRSEQLRERAGKDMLNRAQSMLAQGVPLEGAQMAGVKAWMLDPANGAAGEWGTLERMVRSEERSARIERNSRLADDRRATADARRDAADAARKDKEQQDAHDQEALNGFDDLDPKEQAETDLRAKYPDVDPKGKAFAKLADRKRKAAAALAKDQGVNVTEFKAKVESTALKLGYSKKDTAAFRTQMLDSYLSRADPTTPVLPAEADVMLAEAVVYADVSMGRDVPAWKLRMQGKDVKVAADQPERVRAVVGAPAPAKTGKVRVTGPGGRTGMADEKGLDDWLKAHPGWSR